jgi:tRNA uridine 5-carboxymethylaminomethyl modification enzyme
LRQDNADERMLPHAHALGLLDSGDQKQLVERVERVHELERRLRKARVGGVPLHDLLARPEARIADWFDPHPELAEFSDEEREKLEVRIKYQGYLAREDARIRRGKDLEAVRIPIELDFTQLRGISSEGREKLARIRPLTVAQASRISGVSPADVGVLLVELRRRAG